MRYMLFICTDSTAEEIPADDETLMEWQAEVDRRGIAIAGDRLRGPRDAATVKVRNGRLIVADGPFVETKEYIGGFDILECDSLEDVVDVASRHPMARYGQIEIRPFWPLADTPREP